MQSSTWVFRVEAQSGESLGHFLGRFRRANYLSHKALAEHLGVRVEWVQAWETPSRRRNPSQLQLVALSKLVEVEVKQLSSMLPPEHLHLQTRLCATCYGEVPIHQVVWQRAERTHCARHGLELLRECPVCRTGFRTPALWSDEHCERCQTAYGEMAAYQQKAHGGKQPL